MVLRKAYTDSFLFVTLNRLSKEMADGTAIVTADDLLMILGDNLSVEEMEKILVDLVENFHFEGKNGEPIYVYDGLERGEDGYHVHFNQTILPNLLMIKAEATQEENDALNMM